MYFVKQTPPFGNSHFLPLSEKISLTIHPIWRACLSCNITFYQGNIPNVLLDSPLVIFPSSVHLNIFKHLSTLIYGKYRLPDQLIFLGITSSINGYIKMIYSNDIDKYIHNLHTKDCSYINALMCFR